MTVETQLITETGDDAHETGGGSPAVNNTEAYVNAQFGVTVHGGFRFQSVDVPEGSTINSASLDVIAINTNMDDADADIFTEPVASSAQWVTGAGTDITDRADSTASTPWTANGLGASRVSSPDIGPQVKEVTDISGFASIVSVVCIGRGGGDDFIVTDYLASDTDCAQLTVDYDAAGATVPEMMASINVSRPSQINAPTQIVPY